MTEKDIGMPPTAEGVEPTKLGEDINTEPDIEEAADTSETAKLTGDDVKAAPPDSSTKESFIERYKEWRQQHYILPRKYRLVSTALDK